MTNFKGGFTRGNGLDEILTKEIPNDMGYAEGSVILDPHTGEIKPNPLYTKPEEETNEGPGSSVPEEPEELEESSLYIPYDKFIENVDGYLTGYLYAKEELKKLDAERKPDRLTGKPYQIGFDYKRWEKLHSQTVRISAAFRGLRTQALTEKPELKELFDEFQARVQE